MKNDTLLILAAIGFGTASVLAQDPASIDPPSKTLLEGHSMHGHSFNEGPRQQAYLMGTTGDVRFPVTTQSEEAQMFFNQGIGQLHGFWYFEAERSFRQTLLLDSDCVMAYWGMSMANANNEKRAADLIKKAEPFLESDRLSERERAYVRPLLNYYSDPKGDKKKRFRDLVRDMETVCVEYPEDIEAKAFLAMQIWKNDAYNGIKITSHLSVNTLLDQIFAKDPDHPAHHYRIHLWDHEKPAYALDSAAKCGPSAPGIAHMWHMPGHTYSRVHRYHDACYQQEASARVDHAQMMRDLLMPDQIHNYAHNNGWLVENLGFTGEVTAGVSLAKNLVELPRLAKLKTFDKEKFYDSRRSSYGEGRRRLWTILFDYEMWDEIIALCGTRYLEPTPDPEQRALYFCNLGIAHTWKEDADAARSQYEALEKQLAGLKERREAVREKAKTKAEEKGRKDKELEKAIASAAKPWDSVIKSTDTYRKRLDAYLAVFNKPPREAREQLEKTKGISAFERARLFTHMANYEKACQILKKEVESKRNPVIAHANYIEALRRCGEKDEARKYFEALRPLAARAELDTPPMRRLTALAKEWKFPDDWRVQTEPATDLGDRPDLDELGPFRWEPSPASGWTLTQADGTTRSLSDYHGRPVLLIYFLGRGCVHCMEQLNAFAPLYQAYRDAGIEIVAISTDSPEGLDKTYADAEGEDGAKNPFPFPLASDESLESFKAYRAFDGFEDQPLHGTFLVDGDSKIRWIDIGYEPFMEPEWLLEESRRLLQLPVTDNKLAGAKSN